MRAQEHVVKLAEARMAPSDLAYRPGESIPEHQVREIL